MLSSRIAQGTPAQIMLANLQANQRRLTDIQDQISSGKLLRRPSDGPAGVLSALEYRGQIARNEQIQRNAEDAKNWLESADIALGSAQGSLLRVKELVIQGSNDSLNSEAREAIATEIRQIRDGLLQVAASRYGSRGIFTGTANETVPYQAATGGPFTYAYAYRGDTASVDRTVAPGVSVRVNALGPEAFGPDDATGTNPYGGNLFQVLTQLADDFDSGNVNAVRTQGGGAVDLARERMGGVQASLGARARRIEEVLVRLDDTNLNLKGSLSQVEDVDFAEALIELNAQQAAYQAALNSTARVIQPSLLDFLR
jgi:flagellar hook-associated protein 3 FlgL